MDVGWSIDVGQICVDLEYPLQCQCEVSRLQVCGIGCGGEEESDMQTF